MEGDTRLSNNGQLPELFTAERWERLAGRLALSPRQRQIAELICRGRRNRRIAADLAIASDTVRMHTKELFKRLEVHDRVGVVVRLVLTDRAM